jgi:hypothetical protein
MRWHTPEIEVEEWSMMVLDEHQLTEGTRYMETVLRGDMNTLFVARLDIPKKLRRCAFSKAAHV